MKISFKFFTLFLFLILSRTFSFACDKSSATLTSEVNNGNGTYTYVIDFCVEMSDQLGAPNVFKFTFGGGTVSAINTGFLPNRITTTAGDNYNGSINGLVLRYSFSGIGASNSPSVMCKTVTVTTTGRPETITYNGSDKYSGTTCDHVLDVYTPISCPTPTISWEAGAPLQFDCTDNTNYSLFVQDVLSPGFTISATSGLNITTIYIKEGNNPKQALDLNNLNLPYCSPSYLYSLEVIGSGSGNIILTDNATGNIISTNLFSNVMTIDIPVGQIKGTATFSGNGVSNYQLNYPTNGNTDYLASGYGVFNPSVAGQGNHTITYTWDNGEGCTSTSSIIVTVNCQTNVCSTCATPSCPVVSITDTDVNAARTAITTALGTSSNVINATIAKGQTSTFCVPVTVPNGSTVLGFKQKFTVSPGSCGDPTEQIVTYTLKPTTCSGTGIAPDETNAQPVGSGFNPEWNNLTPGNYVLCYTINNVSGAFCNTVTLDAIGYYNVIPNVTPPTCPSENTFITLDLSASNPFTPFGTNPTFDCNDNNITITKNIDTQTFSTLGELQPVTGFVMNIKSASSTASSALVSVNGVPYSYYGPTASAPSNVLVFNPLSTNHKIMEPYLPAGATITIDVCDTRSAAQSFDYEITDYANGTQLSKGTATPSSANCYKITFNLTSPTMTWDIDGDATKITNNNNGSATFDPSALTAGSHVINYTFNNGTCNLTATQNFTVSAPTPMTFTNLDVCQDEVVNFPSTSSITGTWSPSTLATNVSGSQTYRFTPDAGQCKTFGDLNVTVKPTKTAQFSQLSAPLTFCEGQTTNIPALPLSSDNGLNGTWNPSTINVSSPSATPVDYTFTSGPSNCMTPFTVSVTVNAKVNPSFTAITDLCQNMTAPILPTTSSENITGKWTPETIDNTTPGSITYTFNPEAYECAVSTTMTVNVVEAPTADAIADFYSGVPGLQVNFENLSTEGKTYSWNFGNGQTSTDPTTVKAIYPNEGIYNVVLTVTHDVCPTITWDTTIIVKYLPIKLIVPNVFTPGTDKNNDDYFLILEQAKSFEAYIVNRWGNTIVKLDENKPKWDGKTTDGNDASAGTYFVNYRIIGLDGKIIEGQSYLQLIR